jgi:competence protein ComEA
MRFQILALILVASVASAMNINTAPLASLDSLPGVGPAIAHKIDSARSVLPFTSCKDLDAIKGIGAKKLARICPLVSFVDSAK